MRSASASISGSPSVLLIAALVCGGCESTPPARALAPAPAAATTTLPAATSVPLPPTTAPSVAPSPAPARTAEGAPEAWPVLEPRPEAHDFCPPRVRALDLDACFVLPAKPVTTLLVYLHGIVPPTRESVQKTNLFEVVARSCERAGIVALLPRGEQGYAPAQNPRWWGWPTSKLSYERHAGVFIERLHQKRSQLEQLLGVKFDRVYLAGSSSGAYFVASVLLHGDMPEVAGYGVLSGGSGYATPALPTLPPAPVYVGFGQYDSVAGPARALGTRLAELGWPVRVAAHPVGHGAREVYIDEAVDFWRAQELAPGP